MPTNCQTCPLSYWAAQPQQSSMRQRFEMLIWIICHCCSGCPSENLRHACNPTFPRYRSPDSAAGPFEHHNNPPPVEFEAPQADLRPATGLKWRVVATKGSFQAHRAASAGVGHIDISGLLSLVGLADAWHPSYRRCPRRQRGESSNPFEDRSVQPTRNRHLCHLESDVLGMPNHFGPELDQLPLQRGRQPVLNGTQKVAQVVR